MRDGFAFDSAARLVPGAHNRHDQIYVRDLRARSTVRVSISSQGALANDANLGLDTGLAVDGDGSVIAFRSYATNLVEGDRNRAADVFVHDLETRATSRVSIASNGAEAGGGSAYPSLSADGPPSRPTPATSSPGPGERPRRLPPRPGASARRRSG